jgi:GTPase SAR1 family protein
MSAPQQSPATCPAPVTEHVQKVELLESQVRAGLPFVVSLEETLTKHSSGAESWMKRVEKLKNAGDRPRTVIGILGSTGVGKSSIINALLEEEQFVPTNSRRACTAVVIEISYNHDNGPKYRAEVEFISVDDWKREVRLFFQELEDHDSQDGRSGLNSDVAVAEAKLQAVYGMNREELIQHTVDDLAEDPKVISVLGPMIRILEDDPKAFRQHIKKYLDSGDRAQIGRTPRSKATVDQTEAANNMQLWPLIRVVRLYVKSVILSTGVSIVDLPGLQDSNAARAKVAKSYLEQCSSLWIVAPITRAVDDRTARILLDDAFKRQVQLDGVLGCITFVCSKTDDIDLNEVNESLGVDETLDEASNRLEMTIISLQNQLGLLKSRRTEVKGEIDASYERSATLDAASSGDGEATTLGKRKSTGRQNMDASPDSAKDGLQKRVNEENALRKLNFSRKTTLDAQIEELEREITAINIEKSSLKHDFSRKCIADRNDYAVTHIQQDFAAGIYEMDKKTAANVGFASPHPVRDYNALAESLVVFCVSPRAHQRLRGRQQKGSAILGFKDIEETGIPTLQRFCMDSTLAVRAEAAPIS